MIQASAASLLRDFHCRPAVTLFTVPPMLLQKYAFCEVHTIVWRGLTRLFDVFRHVGHLQRTEFFKGPRHPHKADDWFPTHAHLECAFPGPT